MPDFAWFAGQLKTEADAFTTTLAGADPAGPVLTCPEWTVADLVHHAGRVQYWVAEIVATQASAPIPFDAVAETALPEDRASWATWLRDGVDRLVSAITGAGFETPVWTWAGDRRAGFWLRRLTNDLVIHRADAASAVGQAYTPAPGPAADGITESLELLPSRRAVMPTPGLAALPGSGESLHFHATDDGLGEAGEWLIRRTPDGPVWSHGHEKADVAVRGPAGDLLLVLTERRDPDAVEIFGDAELFTHWVTSTRF